MTKAWSPTDTQVRTPRLIPRAFTPEGGAGIGKLVTTVAMAPGTQTDDWSVMLEALSYSWVV